MNKENYSDSESAEFYMDDQAIQVARYFTGDLVERQRDFLLHLNEDDMPEGVLNALSLEEPDPTNELLYTSIILKNNKQIDEARLPKLVDIAIAFKNQKAEALIIEALLREHEDFEILKKFIKSSYLDQAELVALVMRGESREFIYIVHSTFSKHLLTHFEFCTEGKGCPLWERSGKQHKKQKSDLISMLFTERIALVFSLLISSCDKMLENSLFALLEIYVGEMILHKQSFPGVLYLINLMSAAFKQYFAMQSVLFELLRQAYKPLPHAAYSVNISAYRGKMFDREGHMRFLEVMQHPIGFIESSEWIEQFRSEVTRSIYLYFSFVGGIIEKDPMRLITLPEMINWFYLETEELNEALSGGCAYPGTSEVVQYGSVQKQEVNRYERQLKMLKRALNDDRESILKVRQTISEQELEELFSNDKIPKLLTQELEAIAEKSAIMAEYMRFARSEPIPQSSALEDNIEPPTSIDDKEVQEESFETEEVLEETSAADEIRDLQL